MIPSYTRTGLDWTTGKFFCNKRVIKDWKRLPEEVVEASPLDVLTAA